jgi:hypothetical protein
MMLCPVVAQVAFAGGLIETKSTLSFTAEKPVKSHVHCFCSPRLYIAVGYPTCCAVVGLNGSTRLDVAHFCEELAHWYCLARVDVQCAKFSFCCQRHYCFDELKDVEDSAVVVRVCDIG